MDIVSARYLSPVPRSPTLARHSTRHDIGCEIQSHGIKLSNWGESADSPHRWRRCHARCGSLPTKSIALSDSARSTTRYALLILDGVRAWNPSPPFRESSRRRPLAFGSSSKAVSSSPGIHCRVTWPGHDSSRRSRPAPRGHRGSSRPPESHRATRVRGACFRRVRPETRRSPHSTRRTSTPS